MEKIEIQVVNWAHYNPRADRKNHTWFRLENGVASEAKFFGLTPARKFVAICLLAEVSKSHPKRGDGTASINVAWLASQIGVKPGEIHSTIQHLVDQGVMRLPTGNQAVTDCLTTDVRTNVRNGRTDETPPPPVTAPLPGVRNPEAAKLLERRGVTQAQFATWLAAYPNQPWIEQEVLKAAAWEASDSKNQKTKFAAFIANWLARGWADAPVRAAPPAPKPKPPEEPFDYGPPDPETAAKIRALVNGGIVKDMPK